MTEWSLTQRFAFEGDEIAFDVFGEGAPLVLVHGTPFSSYVWHAIGRELARDFQVHVFDLLGYGQSTMRGGQDVSLGVQNRVLGRCWIIGASPARRCWPTTSAARRFCAPIC